MGALYGKGTRPAGEAKGEMYLEVVNTVYGGISSFATTLCFDTLVTGSRTESYEDQGERRHGGRAWDGIVQVH